METNIREAVERRLRAVLVRELAKALLRVAQSEEQLAAALELPPLPLPPAGEAVAS